MIQKSLSVKLWVILLLLLFPLLGMNGWGEEQEIEDVSEFTLEDLLNIKIEVASAQEKTIFNTPSSVTVINREMIQRYNFLSIDEAVNTVAGFIIFKTSSTASLPTSRWILQDHYANKIIFMINGVPTWIPVTSAAPPLSRININDVERIEILRGPASVLYGTNGYSGAINVVLKKQEKENTLSVEMAAGAGERESFMGHGGFFLNHKGWQLSVSGSGFGEFGDMRTMTDEFGVTGKFRDFRSGFNFVLTSNYKGHSLLFTAFNNHFTKLGKDITFEDALGEPQTKSGFLFNYTFRKNLSEKIDFRMGFTMDWNRRMFPRADGSDLVSNEVGWRAMGFAKALINLNKKINLELGLDYDYRKSEEYRNYYITSDLTLDYSNLKDRTIYEYSGLAQLEYESGKFGLIVGTRFTRNQYYGNNLSSRATAVYTINKKNSLKFIFGQSFRAPSLFEVFFLNPTKSLAGNQDLEPEKATSFEAAYLTSFSNFFVQVLVYHTLYDNKIFRIRRAVIVLPDGEEIYNKRTWTNGERFKATGLELELKYKTQKLDIFGSYTFVDGDSGDEVDGNDHYNFKYVPKHRLVGGISIAMAKNAYISAVGNFFSSTYGPIAKIDPQFRLDMSISYKHIVLGKEIRHAITAKNLLNEETVVPEYVDRNINEIPYDQTRRVMYSVSVSL